MAGNATIGSLRVFLGLDSAEFESGLKKAQGGLTGFGKAAGLAGAAVGVALAGAAAALAGAMKSAIDQADELSKMSQKVGVAVDELSRLKYAGQLADVSLEQLGTGLKKLSKNMADVAAGAGGPAAMAFKALGVSVTDANGQLRPSADVLKDIAEKFGSTADGAGKTALAMAIFGKSGADLIPLLNEGAAGLKQMADEADALGVTIDAKTGKAAEAFNDNLTRLKAVKDGLVTQITARMLPALEAMSNSLIGLARDTVVMDGVAKVLTVTLKSLLTVGAILGAVFKSAGVIVATVAQALMAVVTGDYAKAFNLLKFGAGDVGKSLGQMGDDVKRIWIGTGEAVAKAAPAVGAQLAAPMMHMTKAVKDHLSEQEKAFKRAQDAARDYIKGLQHDVDTFGRSSDQVKIFDNLAAAAAALDAGLDHEAATILRLNDALMQLQAIKKQVIDTDVELIRTPQQLQYAWAKAQASMKSDFEKFQASVDSIRDGFDELYYGIKNNDWTTAFSGLLRAIQNIQKAFATSGVGGGLAATASAAGGAIGGVAGSTLAGAGAGAQIGSMIMPGIGTAIGAVIGGIAGFLGGSSAKKKAAQQAAQQAAAQAAARAQAIADARRELEIRLMELAGDAAGALAARRTDELAAMDASLRPLQEQVYAAEDLAAAQQKLADAQAEAAAKAQALAATGHALEIQYLQASGDALGALNAQRADELAALDATLRPLQLAVYAMTDAQAALAKAQEDAQAKTEAAQQGVEDARSRLTDAYQRESDALKTTIDRFQGFADSLAAFREQLSSSGMGGGAAGQYFASRAAFQRQAALAAAGDEGGLGGLQGAAQAFLDASKAAAPSARAYQKDLAAVRQAVTAAEAAARGQVSSAQQQLSALQATVGSLIQVNDSVLSVRDAIVQLQGAMTAAAEAQAASQAMLAAAMAAVAAAAASKPVTPAQLPGGAGGDTSPVTPVPAGGAVSPTVTAAQDANSTLVQIAINTGQVARLNRRWDGDGLPETRVVAA